MCEGEEEVAKEISEFFQNLFMTSNPYDGNGILGRIRRKITDSMNTRLTRQVDDQEIKSALFSMNPHKAPDGVSPFFQQFWNILGSDLCSAVRVFFEYE